MRWATEARSVGRERFQKLELRGEVFHSRVWRGQAVLVPSNTGGAIPGCPEFDSESSFNSEVLCF